MKKLFVSACMALALFAMVSCSSNPGIDAAKDFIDDPTPENLEKMSSATEGLSSDEEKEAEEWLKEHEEEMTEALEKCIMDGFGNAFKEGLEEGLKDALK